jgi:two-component system phosphate regulon response regulator OmpR
MIDCKVSITAIYLFVSKCCRLIFFKNISIIKNMKQNILIIDDDIEICKMLSLYLNEQGFITSAVGSGKEMDKWLKTNTPDLVLLDLMLPEEDGLSIAKRLRYNFANLPIIMLSAKGDEIDRIIGLEVGADDYLPKPFNPRELLARIHARLRNNQPTNKTPDNIFEFGDYVFNHKTLILTKNDKEITLSHAETQLLQLFIQNQNKPISREFILDNLLGMDYDPFDRTIDVRIARLRKKIEKNPANPEFIRTMRGVGYRFTP